MGSAFLRPLCLYIIVYPPLTLRVWPVMKLAAAELIAATLVHFQAS